MTQDCFLNVSPDSMARAGVVGTMKLIHADIRYMHTAIMALVDKLKSASDPASLVAALRPNILVTGETGTGKELVTKAIRERLIEDGILSDGSDNYGSVNCACLASETLEIELFGTSEGAFTDAGNLLGIVPRLAGFTKIDPKKGLMPNNPQAAVSILFLDEVGTTDVYVQAKLLRLLENREFTPLGVQGKHYYAPSLIVVAATNELQPSRAKHMPQVPMTSRAAAGSLGRSNRASSEQLSSFRTDFYYRLSDTFHFHLPPLSDRKEEIPLIAEQFYQKYFRLFFDPQAKPSLPLEVKAILTQVDWPGNGRQLHQVIRRSLILWRSSQKPEDFLAIVQDEIQKTKG